MTEGNDQDRIFESFKALYEYAVDQGEFGNEKTASIYQQNRLEPAFVKWLVENQNLGSGDHEQYQSMLTMRNLKTLLNFEQEEQRKKDIINVWVFDSLITSEIPNTSCYQIWEDFKESKNYGKLFNDMRLLAHEQFKILYPLLENYLQKSKGSILAADKTKSKVALSIINDHLKFHKVWLLEKSNRLDSYERIYLERIVQGADYNMFLSTVIVLYKNGNVGMLEPIVELEKLLRERLDKDLRLVEGYISLLEERIKAVDPFEDFKNTPAEDIINNRSSSLFDQKLYMKLLDEFVIRVNNNDKVDAINLLKGDNINHHITYDGSAAEALTWFRCGVYNHLIKMNSEKLKKWIHDYIYCTKKGKSKQITLGTITSYLKILPVKTI